MAGKLLNDRQFKAWEPIGATHKEHWAKHWGKSMKDM
jgi:hypothetical protein